MNAYKLNILTVRIFGTFEVYEHREVGGLHATRPTMMIGRRKDMDIASNASKTQGLAMNTAGQASRGPGSRCGAARCRSCRAPT